MEQRKLSEIPEQFVRTMRAMRAQGATLAAIRDWMMSHGQPISVTGVFKLCQDLRPQGEKRAAVRRRVASGMTRKAAAALEGVSPTSAQRWCIDLPRSGS